LDMKVTPLREGSATNASALWWSRLGRVSDSGMPSMWAPQEMCGLPTPCLMLMFDPFQRLERVSGTRMQKYLPQSFCG
jgi:hypothetical protein